MKKTEKILNEIIESHNDKKVKKAVNQLLDCLGRPQPTYKAILVSELPIDINKYENWYFNSHEAEDILYLSDIRHQYKCSQSETENADNSFCENDVTAEIKSLYNYMKKHKIDFLINT
jgi:hypothetical protein